LIPYERGDVVSLLHEQAIINHQSHQAEGTRMVVYVPEHLQEVIQPFQLASHHA
jgi:hypothetical protein